MGRVIAVNMVDLNVLVGSIADTTSVTVGNKKRDRNRIGDLRP